MTSEVVLWLPFAHPHTRPHPPSTSASQHAHLHLLMLLFSTVLRGKLPPSSVLEGLLTNRHQSWACGLFYLTGGGGGGSWDPHLIIHPPPQPLPHNQCMKTILFQLHVVLEEGLEHRIKGGNLLCSPGEAM